MTYCGICGIELEPTALTWFCPDCPALLCSSKHWSEHRELGTCPEHADGVTTPADLPAPKGEQT